jgi:membrane protein YdbS with pleckstrin-like domain
MSETEAVAPAPPPSPPPAPPPAPEWRTLPHAAATTAMFGGAFVGLLLGLAPALGGGIPLATRGAGWSWWQAVLLVVAIWLLSGALGTWLAYRRWRSSAWKLDESGLRFRRGWLWQAEILVPRSRVQHLDIERGPIERHYGLATLIVHTAGTRHHALRIAGLDDADAVALRDALVPASARHDDVL